MLGLAYIQLAVEQRSQLYHRNIFYLFVLENCSTPVLLTSLWHFKKSWKNCKWPSMPLSQAGEDEVLTVSSSKWPVQTCYLLRAINREKGKSPCEPCGVLPPWPQDICWARHGRGVSGEKAAAAQPTNKALLRDSLSSPGKENQPCHRPSRTFGCRCSFRSSLQSKPPGADQI